jgi:hypothetical protein
LEFCYDSLDKGVIGARVNVPLLTVSLFVIVLAVALVVTVLV